jgi:hypothetical protein
VLAAGVQAWVALLGCIHDALAARRRLGVASRAIAEQALDA